MEINSLKRDSEEYYAAREQYFALGDEQLAELLRLRDENEKLRHELAKASKNIAPVIDTNVFLWSADQSKTTDGLKQTHLTFIVNDWVKPNMDMYHLLLTDWKSIEVTP